MALCSLTVKFWHKRTLKMPFKIICLRNIKMRAKIVFFANLMRQPVVLNLLIITTELSVYGSVSDPQVPCSVGIFLLINQIKLILHLTIFVQLSFRSWTISVESSNLSCIISSGSTVLALSVVKKPFFLMETLEEMIKKNKQCWLTFFSHMEAAN